MTINETVMPHILVQIRSYLIVPEVIHPGHIYGASPDNYQENGYDEPRYDESFATRRAPLDFPAFPIPPQRYFHNNP
jgi:hypothetical protein